MARLILDDGGKRRAFKLNPGRMTIGSGEGATLRLDSGDVAEVHAELRAATFCLEPQGDTPFRSQVFECLVRSSPPGTVGANPASRWP